MDMTRFALMKMMGQTRLPFPTNLDQMEKYRRMQEMDEEDEEIEEERTYLTEVNNEERKEKKPEEEQKGKLKPELSTSNKGSRSKYNDCNKNSKSCGPGAITSSHIVKHFYQSDSYFRRERRRGEQYGGVPGDQLSEVPGCPLCPTYWDTQAQQYLHIVYW